MLDESGLTPDRLKLEVLETAFFGDRVDQVADTIHRLSRMGVVCSLDDFGTGYASLTHLKTFKVERLKIDMSFVKNILSDPFDKAITRSVIDLGRNLGMRVTAEGIETKEQLRLLQDFGCDCGQGYLFGRPMPAHEVPHALTAWHGGRSACILDRFSDWEEPALSRGAIAVARRALRRPDGATPCCRGTPRRRAAPERRTRSAC